MKFRKFNDNWKFWQVTNSFVLNWAPPADARMIDLPHDAMVEIPISPDAPSGTNTGFRRGGVFSYSKNFYAESSENNYVLKVEGAYMNAFVYVNGQLAAKRPFGYTVFYVNMNDYLEFGKDNELRITVRAGAEPNSRWYSGAGLYRDVYLLESGKEYLIPDGIKIKTVDADDNAALITITAVAAGIRDTAVVKAVVTDRMGNIVAEGSEKIYASEAMEPKCTPVNRIAGDIPVNTSDISLSIKRPELWDENNPVLYKADVILEDESGRALDTHTESFGIRTLSLSPSEGLKVNGKEVKLRGSCIHHDSGILGAKTYSKILYRQIKKLKDAGFNAIRCAHNPAAPELLKACDALGMYVMDEAFDVWTRNKTDYDYSLYFNEWWEADIESMVNNSYNHPSVIMYSVGNEIPEIGTKAGERITRMLCDKVKSIDDTRYTTVSVNGIFSVGDAIGKIVMDTAEDLTSKGEFEGNVNDFMAFMNQYMQKMTAHPIVDSVISRPFALVDVAGYNYMGGRYDIDPVLHPDRVILGSEDGISSAYDDWMSVLKHKGHIGEFTWTGWDYIGESGLGKAKYGDDTNVFSSTYPVQTGCAGDIDITGHRLPMSYYREIIFGLRKDPYIAVKDPAHFGDVLTPNPWVISDAVSSWNWDEYKGKPVMVEVYSAGDEVELKKNGVSLGRKELTDENRHIVHFQTDYEAGELTADSYSEGKIIGSYTLKTSGDVVKLNICEESEIPETKEEKIRVINITLEDKDGRVVPDKDSLISIEIEGAELLGFGNGDSCQENNFTDLKAMTYRGRALLLIKSIQGMKNVIKAESAYGKAELVL